MARFLGPLIIQLLHLWIIYGNIICKNVGSAVISVTLHSENAEDISAFCSITVKSPTVSLNVTSATLYTCSNYNTIKLMATAVPTGTVSWNSSNPSVATVDKSGNVSAIKAGKCLITATVNGVTSSCTLTVKQPSIKLNTTTVTIKKKGTYTLVAACTPSGTVKWESNNTAVATVNSNGAVKGIKKGSATITATANGVSVKCKVTIN